jgi:hypothetical protein
MDKNNLPKAYSYMFEDSSGKEPITLYNFETPPGWDNLLKKLLMEIYLVDTENGVRIRQVKSKFGGLRFYFHWVGPERKPTLHNKYIAFMKNFPWKVSLFFWKHFGIFPFRELGKEHKKIVDIVQIFEREAEHTCEDCGKEGKQITINHWIYTLCNKCLSERESVEVLGKIIREENLLGSGNLQPRDL